MWFRSLLPKRVRHWGWLAWEFFLAERNRLKALWRHFAPRRGRPHGLGGELIVSLTSYPARFGTLHLTLACLMDQSVRPDRVVLWIAHGDLESLPRAVRMLEGRHLEIRPCDDLRSFKKLVPALEAYPDAFIATADDDLYYASDWLEALVDGAVRAPRAIIGHRAVRVTRSEDGRFCHFAEWALDVQDEAARLPSGDIMCEGGAGSLYPPHSLDKMVTEHALFQRLSPNADDLWFFWCARMAGTLCKKVAGSQSLIPWRGSQQGSLWEENKAGGNDRAILKLESEFGLPV